MLETLFRSRGPKLFGPWIIIKFFFQICKSKLSYGGKKKYYFLHGSVSVGNSCSHLLATSFTSPFTQVWDEMLSSGDAGDRKLQLRGQERGEDEPLRADSATNNRKEGDSHLIAQLRENPEHLSAQRLSMEQDTGSVHILLGTMKCFPQQQQIS